MRIIEKEVILPRVFVIYKRSLQKYVPIQERSVFASRFKLSVKQIVCSIPEKKYNKAFYEQNKKLTYLNHAIIHATLIQLILEKGLTSYIAEKILYEIHIKKFSKKMEHSNYKEYVKNHPDARFNVGNFWDYLLKRIKAGSYDYKKGTFFSWWNKVINNYYRSSVRDLKKKENCDDSEERKMQKNNPEGTSYDVYARNIGDKRLDGSDENGNTSDELIYKYSKGVSKNIDFLHLDKEVKKRLVEEMLVEYERKRTTNCCHMLCFFLFSIGYKPNQIIIYFHNSTLRDIYDIIICQYSLENGYSQEYVKKLLKSLDRELSKSIKEGISSYATKTKSVFNGDLSTKMGDIKLQELTGKNPQKTVSRSINSVIKTLRNVA